jgi:hypothetical protein
MFCFCLKHIIHYIVSIRQCHPTKRVLAGNFDWKSAYCRARLSGQTSLEIITQLNGFMVAFIRVLGAGHVHPNGVKFLRWLVT